MWGTNARGLTINKDVVTGKDTIDRTSQILLKPYPFDKLGLPFLKDSGKYESGKFGDLFWHQDTDHVYVFYPVPDDLRRSEVTIRFDYQHVIIKINDEERLSFLCYDRITESSLWSFEYDNNGKKYIYIDLEKRLRYVNWKGLFGGLPNNGLVDTPEERMKVLQKIYQANQGLAKLSGEGTRPASMEEMLEDEDMMSRIYANVDTKPYPMTNEEVTKEGLDKKLYKRMLRDRKKELGLISEEEIQNDEVDGDELEPFPENPNMEIESPDLQEEEEIKERSDDDLGDYDPEEIDNVKKSEEE